MTCTIEQELRYAYAGLERARQALTGVGVERRESVNYEIAQAQTSIGRCLHLLAGVVVRAPGQEESDAV